MAQINMARRSRRREKKEMGQNREDYIFFAIYTCGHRV